MPQSHIAFDKLNQAETDFLMPLLRKIGTPREQLEDSATYGDAATMTLVIALAPAIIGVIGAYLLRPRTDQRDTVDYQFRRVAADGSWTECTIRITRMERETKKLSPASIKAIAQLTQLTPEQVASVLQTTTE